MNMSTEKQTNISLFYFPYTKALKRGDTLNYIIFGTQLRDLYSVDLARIGSEAVIERLTPLLEDRYIDKVVFDSRYISDVLQSTYNCRINSFLDVQLLEVMTRERFTLDEIATQVLDIADFIRKFGSPADNLNCDSNVHYQSGQHPCHTNECSSHSNECSSHSNESSSHSNECSSLGNYCDVIEAMWQGRSELASPTKQVDEMFALMNDTLFTFIENNNPSVTVWTKWWVNSSRYSDILRSKERRMYDRYDINNFLPTNVLSIAKSFKIGVKCCNYCKRTLSMGCFERSRTRRKCRTCQMVDKQRKHNRTPDHASDSQSSAGHSEPDNAEGSTLNPVEL